MGLLDFNDPQVIAGLGLLSGQQVPQALMAMQAARSAQANQKQSQLQLEQMQKQIAEQEQKRLRQQQLLSGQSQFMRQAAQPQALDPRQQEGGAQVAPGVPGGFDTLGYSQWALGQGLMSPLEAAQLAQKEDPYAKIDPKDYTPESFQRFAQTRDHGVLVPYRKPEKKNYHYQDLGEHVGVFSEDGQLVSKMSKSRAPKEPEKAPAPQMVETPNGPIWVTPPPRGSGSQPVVGPDNQPLPPKKDSKPLTESQGTAALYLGMMKDAEAALKSSGFDPRGGKNQTWLAFARGEIPHIPKPIQNAVAGGPAQKYSQGMYQWTEAMLRATTGATAPEPEVWRMTKTYFPMPGDDDATIAKKNAARAKMVDYMAIKAGGGAGMVDAARGARDPLGFGSEGDPLGIRQ